MVDSYLKNEYRIIRVPKILPIIEVIESIETEEVIKYNDIIEINKITVNKKVKGAYTKKVLNAISSKMFDKLFGSAAKKGVMVDFLLQKENKAAIERNNELVLRKKMEMS